MGRRRAAKKSNRLKKTNRKRQHLPVTGVTKKKFRISIFGIIVISISVIMICVTGIYEAIRENWNSIEPLQFIIVIFLKPIYQYISKFTNQKES